MTVDPNDVPSMRFKPREERRKYVSLPHTSPPYIPWSGTEKSSRLRRRSESLFYASWGGIPRQIREHYVRNPKEAEPSTA